LTFATLKKRADFLRIRSGPRFSTPAFVLEAKAQQAGADEAGPRFGFTVTKKIGNAVVRNRIRRRLRAVVDLLAAREARSNFDYVLIARAPALARSFDDLKKDLEHAFQRVHHPPARERRTRGP
jgi:ribonuclease P protein component